MVRGETRRLINESGVFAFLYGAFDLPGWRIPYLSLAMKFEDAATALKTTYDMPKADQQEWTLEGLFQRDIHWPRVDSEIIPYLRSTADPAFFPAITVAMLPYDPENNIMLSDFREEHAFNAPKNQNNELAKVLNIGPITLGWYDSWNELSEDAAQQGAVRWNLDQVQAVAIDGQHRLGAIKRIMEDLPAEKPKFRNARQPITMLIFDKALGFRPPDGVGEKPLLELIRLLFIDLNKHARPVHRARLILLEDLEPHARCVREVLAPAVAPDISSLTVEEPRLPLSLADWHSESAKFDTGPYLTSVMTLDWIIATILTRAVVTDYMKYQGVNKELGAMKRSLGVDLSVARARLTVAEVEQVPFSYTRDEVDEIRKEFRRLYTPSICYLLTKFTPYQSLLSLRSANQSLGMEFQHWWYLSGRLVKNVVGRADHEYQDWLTDVAGRPGGLSETVFEDAQTEIEEHKRGNIAFNIAFQRAYFIAWLEFAKLNEDEINALIPLELDLDELRFDEDEDDPLSDSEQDDPLSDSEEEEFSSEDEDPAMPREVKILNRAKRFVDTMNQLVDAWEDILSVEATLPVGDQILDEERNALSPWFWAGTLWKQDDRVIDPSKSASDRAGDLLFIMVAMIVYDEMTSPGVVNNFYDFWHLVDDENDQPVSAFIKRVRLACLRQKKKSNPHQGFTARIIAQHPDDLEYDEGLAGIELEVRLKFIWETLGL
jgi:hypothetical protein